MSQDNDLDLQTFQVYPDEEPVKTKTENSDKKSKKGVVNKTSKNKDVSKPAFSGKQKKSVDINTLMKKISPVTACVIGVGVVFVYIAFDIVTSI